MFSSPRFLATIKRLICLTLLAGASALVLIQLPAAKSTAVAPDYLANPMTVAREGHTATQLQNGKVLLAGGRSDGGALGSADLYDPVLNEWAPTSNGLSNPRSGHVAVLLRDGQVLVAGGQGSNADSLDTVEIYDPASNTWTVQSNRLKTPRHHATATLLANGRVLLVGGQNNGGYLRSVEVYDPATRVWASLGEAGNLAEARAEHTATLLSDGRVLVAGGWNGMKSLPGAELFELSRLRWRRAGELRAARHQHTATRLPDGTVLIAGGTNGSNSLASTEIYNPPLATFSTSGGLIQARRAHTATLLPNGRVFVAGGRDSNGNPINSTEVYNPAASGPGIWTPAPLPPPFSASPFSLRDARSDHTATMLPNGQVLVAGGLSTGNAALMTSEIYDYAAGTWSVTKDRTASATSVTTEMNVARVFHTATLLPDGTVLVVGGLVLGPGGTSFVSTDSAERYDPNTGRWETASPLKRARARHTATLLPDGRVLVVGGVSGTALNSAEIYNPSTGAWTETAAPGVARYRHTATLLPNGRVLIVGGLQLQGTASVQTYDPTTGAWSNQQSLNAARYDHSATLLPNGTVFVFGGLSAGGNNALNTGAIFTPNGTGGGWTYPAFTDTIATAIPEFRYGHTATLLPTNKVLISGGRGGRNAANIGLVIGNSEIYDINSRTIERGRATTASRINHTATLLPNGKVLLVGGRTVGSSFGNCPFPSSNPAIQLFDPSRPTGLSVAGITDLGQARNGHTATLLTNGQVLIAGGAKAETLPACADDLLRHSELFDPGLGFEAFWRPTLTDVRSSTAPLTVLTANGTLFQGVSEASGHGGPSSGSNYPIAQLRSLGNEQMAILRLDSTGGWSNNSFAFTPVSGFAPGLALLTLYANGIPSISRIVSNTGADTTVNPSANLGSIRGRVIYHNGEGFSSTISLTLAAGSPTVGCSAPRTITTSPNGEYSFPDLIIFPSPLTCPPDLTVAGSPNGAIVQYPVPTLTGARVTCAPASGSVFPVGTTTVTCTAFAGTTESSSCSFKVTVIATPPPTITCPSNITVTSSTGGPVPVSYPAPTATPCCPTVSCSPASGSTFPVGTTPVTCRATNIGGSSSCSFFVRVLAPPIGVATPGEKTVTSPTKSPPPPATRSKATTSHSPPTRSRSGPAVPPTVAPQQSQNSCRYQVRPSFTSARGPVNFFPATRIFIMTTDSVTVTGSRLLMNSPSQEGTPTTTCKNCTNGNYVTTSVTGNGGTASTQVIDGTIRASQNGPHLTDAHVTFTVPGEDGAGFGGGNLSCIGNDCRPSGGQSRITIYGDPCVKPHPEADLDPFFQNFCVCTRFIPDTTICEETVLGRNIENVPSPPAGFVFPVRINETGFFVTNIPFHSNAIVTPTPRTGGHQYAFAYQPDPLLPAQPFIRRDAMEENLLDQMIAALLACTPSTPVVAASGPTTFCEGGSVSLTAPAGFASYQWSNGATTPSITVSAAGSFSVRVTDANGCQSYASNPMTVTVTPQVAISSQPANQAVCAGASATFSVTASGSALTYQWRKDGVEIPNATGSSFALQSVTADNAGAYTVEVSSACGTLRSNAATLVVNSITLSESTRSFPASGGASSVNVNAPAGQCAWNAASNADWITITSGASGTGSGTVNYSVAVNNGADSRSGTMTIAGQTFTVTQPSGAVAQNYEGDVAPRPTGDGILDDHDLLQIGRFVLGLDTPENSDEFMRADCGPRLAPDGVTQVLGDGQITIRDWVSAERYAAGLDPHTLAGGPPPLIPAPRLVQTPIWNQFTDLLNAVSPRTMRLIQSEEADTTSRSVMVELNALGGESAFSFSLRFDPARWRVLSITASRELKEARLLLNRTEETRGRTGIALALAPGESLSAGRYELLRITVASLSPDTNLLDHGPATGTRVESAPVYFADEPAAREVVDAEANLLPANFTNDLPVATFPSAATLFTADAGEKGLAAGVVMRVKGDGSMSFDPIVQLDPVSRELRALPIELERDSEERVFLLLFGTGIRYSKEKSLIMDGAPAELAFAGAQGGSAGLDQVSIPLSRELAGKGEIDLILVVDGQKTNAVRVSFR